MSIYRVVALPATPLPIRLLRLFPAPTLNDDIKCELFPSNLDGEHTFEALSYTWGSEANPATITLQGEAREVTQNLAAALRHLRFHDRDRVLWVDALCINQNDTVEKSMQVDQMRQVYTRSCTSRVLVWLGDEGTAGAALKFMKQLKASSGRNAKLSKTTARYFPDNMSGLQIVAALGAASAGGANLTSGLLEAANASTIALQDDIMKAYESPDYFPRLLVEDSGDWKICEDLLSRNYWTRTWILQEVIHAGEVLVHIGRLAPIDIDSLCELAVSFQKWFNPVSEFARTGLILSAQHISSIADPSSPFLLHELIKAAGRGELVHEMIKDMREKYQEGAKNEGAAFSPALAPLLAKTRRHLAKDARDKIYGLVGMSNNSYQIKTNYETSIEDLYTTTTRHLLSRVLVVLSWVESPDREKSGLDLPSWVVDFTTTQEPLVLMMYTALMGFSANKNFPPTAAKEPHLEQALDCRVLILRGIQVGRILEVRTVRIPSPDEKDDQEVRIFGYETVGDNPTIHAIDRPGLTPSFRNTSWGPKKCQPNDIIIVAPGSTVPLVLRSDGGEWLFVGMCWVIESEIQNWKKMIEASSAPGVSSMDPGLSSIMAGGVCTAAKESDVKLFHIR
ncbi:hypothetical protein FGG08_000844 [Glutinoglossum americanum]|uniref:Heterokaryon incompatibility domain-containing protein n=1 Tax=Glutinoglossum americanum TaxID=1670608 RepID=A0A9P8ICN4_9PEZI|nr:hypothetical protein FGG08_000844 [Glutinoglossum americanum]